MRSALAAILLVATVLAGCSSGDGGGGPPLRVDPDTGGIRGLVVDQGITPVVGATITLNSGETTESGDDGAFNFTGLAPGDHFLSVTKAGFKAVQATANVVAGEAEPDIVKVLLERLTTATPYLDHFKLDGYYECAFSFGQPGDPVITDSCDFGYRTAWDEANSTGNKPPAPRTVQRSINTQFIDIPSDTFAIVQEAFWESETVPVMMILLSSTPIDNFCDCSETDYIDTTMASPTYARLDRYNATGEDKGFPVGQTVAARGFLDWETPSTAQNLQFTVLTTLFHNYVPDPDWTFETRDTFPVGN
jgi:hypothetical protein